MSEHSYDFWHRALADPKQIGSPQLPVHDGAAHPGFYRRRLKKGGPFVPVAIFVHKGELVALVNGERADPAEIWNFTCEHPVSEAAYHQAMETGRWDDVDPNIKPAAPEAQYQPIIAPPPMGHNAPQDPAEAIKDQIESARAGLKAYETIETDAQLARGQSLLSRLLELSREADKARVAEKEPHHVAGKAVDARWMPLVKAAKEAADTIARSLSAFLTAKAKAEEEERRKAEEAARKAAEAGKPAPAPEHVAPGPQPTQVRPGYGRAASIRVVWVVDIDDQDELYRALRDRPEVKETLLKLANRLSNDGHKLPGVSLREERRVS